MVFWKEWSFFILMTYKEWYLYRISFHSHFGENFRADFHLKTGVRELFLTRFDWSSEKSEVFSTLWLIRSATFVKTVFTVIIGKNFSADFHLKREWEDFFLHFYLVFWEEWSFFILMTYKEWYLYTNSFQSHLWKKFSCWFSFKNGSERTFSNTFWLFFWKEWSFSTLWLIRSATFVKTVFTVIIGKNFSADFHLKTGVRGLFLTLLFGLLKRVKFFHPYD